MPSPSAYTDITARVRTLLNDRGVTGGAVFDDTFLVDNVKAAQEVICSYLVLNSIKQMKFRAQITVTSGTTLINDSSSPALPDASNFLAPDRLWEAPTGATADAFVDMVGPHTLPQRVATSSLMDWDWRGVASANGTGVLVFVGATQNRLVQIDYFAGLTPTAGSGSIALIGATDAIASLASGQICASRDEMRAAEYFGSAMPDGTVTGRAGFFLTAITGTQTKAEQSVNHRRRSSFPTRYRVYA